MSAPCGMWAGDEVAFVGLGANLGAREQTLRAAIEQLVSTHATALEALSSFYETEPVGGPPGQPRYLNAVARVRTGLSPEALLARLLAIERALGRDRSAEVRFGPRPVDLDLLVHGRRQIRSERLVLPHPRLPVRRFVLEPLCEIAPELRVPGCARSVRALLDALRSERTMAGAMEIVETKAAMRALRERLEAERATIGFVPTMGALHAGHLSLVRAARAACDRVVASVFVNPLQFGPGEDYERYPRDREGDAAQLAQAGADVCFFAEAGDMYAPRHATYVVGQGPALGLESDVRPTHFRGVLTVVLKLLHLVAPDRLYLGQKDYQQSVVVRRMIEDLDFETELIVCPTVREIDGLAMSSRNAYLSSEQRALAVAIPRALAAAKAAFDAGVRDVDRLEEAMQAPFRHLDGIELEYAVVRDRETLEPLSAPFDQAVALIAARLGSTRLIDNALLETNQRA